MMRVILRSLALIIALVIFNAAQSQSQEALSKLSRSYFKSDPYAGSFSGFLQRLLGDTGIINREIIHRSDTSLYSLIGDYKNFNPFFFKPHRIEISLMETEFRLQQDSPTIDTIFVYEIMAFADSTEKGLADVKKEFNRIVNQNKKRFYQNKYFDQVDEKQVITGGIQHFFIPFNCMGKDHEPTRCSFRTNENASY